VYMELNKTNVAVENPGTNSSITAYYGFTNGNANLQVVNLAPTIPFVPGDYFQLFNQPTTSTGFANSNFNGHFTITALPSLANSQAGILWNTNTLYTDGSIQIEGINLLAQNPVSIAPGNCSNVLVTVTNFGQYSGSIGVYSNGGTLPAGSTVSVSPSNVTVPGSPSSTVTICLPVGATSSYTLTISGTNGDLVNTISNSITISVNGGSPIPPPPIVSGVHQTASHQLYFTISNGVANAGGQFRILSTPVITNAMTHWTPVVGGTQNYDGFGNYIWTNTAATTNRLFFRVEDFPLINTPP